MSHSHLIRLRDSHDRCQETLSCHANPQGTSQTWEGVDGCGRTVQQLAEKLRYINALVSQLESVKNTVLSDCGKFDHFNCLTGIKEQLVPLKERKLCLEVFMDFYQERVYERMGKKTVDVPVACVVSEIRAETTDILQKSLPECVGRQKVDVPVSRVAPKILETSTKDQRLEPMKMNYLTSCFSFFFSI